MTTIAETVFFRYVTKSFIYISKKLVDDSRFPFKQGDELMVRMRKLFNGGKINAFI